MLGTHLRSVYIPGALNLSQLALATLGAAKYRRCCSGAGSFRAVCLPPPAAAVPGVHPHCRAGPHHQAAKGGRQNLGMWGLKSKGCWVLGSSGGAGRCAVGRLRAATAASALAGFLSSKTGSQHTF